VTESGGDTSTLGSMVWPTTCRNVTQYRSYYHTGIDIACSDGAAIYAADGGTVSFTGWNGGYGYQIKVRQDDGTETAYAHIRPGGILVRNGQRVGRGQPIAEMGTTGYSTGYHVHFEVIVGGGFANPLDYM
jgi:murein DD-endopeptidase MepM/ murein hydrolase activator NlpD